MLTRETVTFRDGDGWSWEFDLAFMLSNYQCIWGRGCPDTRLQHTARQPLETAGYETRMDVIAKIHGGGVSAQAGALRHGVARALVEADPNLRTELKRRGFLTRDARVKERKKAGLKKARKRPQFSKR